MPQISPLPLAEPSPVVYPFPPHGDDHLFPVEILSEIFQITAETWHGYDERAILEYKKNLMLVCRYWYTVILSTPGIRSTLRIRRATQKGVIQTFLQARTRWLMDVIVDMNDVKDGNDFNADNFHASFMAAAQAASRWRSLRLISPPPRGEFDSLQISQPLKQLESFELAQGFGMFVDLFMAAISRTTTPRFTTMELADPVAIPYIVQPACSHSLVTLKIQLSKRMDSAVDVLPYLQRLETLVAHHLFLPIYPPDASLPLIQTLRKLNLKSVSVQWMAGHIFPALKECSIILPHHAGAIYALQPVMMPSCSDLTYTHNDLSPLTHFHSSSLNAMAVKSGQWSIWRGDVHLLAVHHILAASAQSMTRLHLDVQCSEQLLVYILRLLPNLDYLWLGLASPNALSEAFFQAFILGWPSSVGGSEVVRIPSSTVAPLCTSLEVLHLHCKRWLRGADKRSLLLAFRDIGESRHQKKFELRLSFEEAPKEQFWVIGRGVRSNNMVGLVWLEIKCCGISSQYGMIAMSARWSGSGPLLLPFKEVKYLELRADTSISFLCTPDHMELMKYDSNRQRLPTPLLHNFPLFHALRVLVLYGTGPSFLAGHTFHQLERCRVVTWDEVEHTPDNGLFTEMPVCTRLVTDSLTLLSTFKLPRIHELAVEFRDLKSNMIWEKQIAVSTNLSGLKLLHMAGWHFHGNLDQILRPLQSLETLIISFSPDVECFGSLLPLCTNEASGLQQSSNEGRSPAFFCPMLQSLQIEGADPSRMPSLTPFLKAVVTLRAVYGFPLKSFTFSTPHVESGNKFELIGSDGSFTMENSVLTEYARAFELDI